MQAFPHLYWINVSSDVRRRTRMQETLDHHRVSNTRVPAIEGMSDRHMSTYATGAPKNQRMEYSATSSHLFAMKCFLDDRENQDEYAWIAEDDLSFEYVPHWSRTMKEYISSLPATWQVFQLAVIAPSGTAGLSTQHAVHREDASWYSACTYLIKRETAVKFLDDFMTTTPALESRIVFPPTHEPSSFIIDVLLYRDDDTFTIPLFTYEGIDSWANPDHVPLQARCKKEVTRLWLPKEPICRNA